MTWALLRLRRVDTGNQDSRMGQLETIVTSRAGGDPQNNLFLDVKGVSQMVFNNRLDSNFVSFWLLSRIRGMFLGFMNSVDSR